MVLLYMVLHGSHQYIPFMLAYIPAPWIRHGIWDVILPIDELICFKMVKLRHQPVMKILRTNAQSLGIC